MIFCLVAFFVSFISSCHFKRTTEIYQIIFLLNLYSETSLPVAGPSFPQSESGCHLSPGFTLLIVSSTDLFWSQWILNLFKHLQLLLSRHSWTEPVLCEPGEVLWSVQASHSSSNTRDRLSRRKPSAVNLTVKLLQQSVRQREVVGGNPVDVWAASATSHRPLRDTSPAQSDVFVRTYNLVLNMFNVQNIEQGKHRKSRLSVVMFSVPVQFLPAAFC